MGRELPTGTVTFLFTDIEGSTRLLRAAGDDYAGLLNEHRRIVRDAIARNAGHEVGTEGDSFFVTFTRPSDAIKTALEAQLGLCAHDWPPERAVRVRMGLHTGEASVVADDYVGLAVHQAHRVSSAAHGCQVLVSATTADLVGDTLPADTSLRDVGFHRLKDIERPQQLFQLLHPGLPHEFESPTSAAVLRTNLPVQLTSFVGREADIEEAERLLGTSRLLTLTGAGGIGKTRLGVELAGRVIRSYPDGAWMADLAPTAEPAFVPQTVGFALGLADQEGGTSWDDRVVDHLRDKTALLLLDNCEHLVGACAELTMSILRRCPAVQVVVTSREPLGLEGETAWRVPSLAVSEGEEGSEEPRGAARLFIERARELTPSFSAQMNDVAEICRHLDGIPLAIELAAARTQALSTSQILDRLDDRFRLLRGSGRRRIERQQTLRATVDWSYELLDDDERTVLRRASVFAGGFTLAGAEAVCSGDGIERDDIIELLESLVRKSLVVFDVESDGGARYRMLETIRQYALEKLLATTEGAEMRTRHRAAFFALAEEAERAVLAIDGQDVEVVDRLEAELDNIRAALEWAPPGDDGEVAMRMCGALFFLFTMRGHLSEGLRRTLAALDADTGAPAEARLAALNTASTCAFHQNDIALVQRLCSEALALAESIPERPENAFARAGALIGAATSGARLADDAARAMPLLEEAVAVGRRAKSAAATGWALMNVGVFKDAFLGDPDGALAALEESVQMGRGAGWGYMVFPILANVMLARDDVERAREMAEEALRGSRKARYPLAIVRSLSALSAVAARQHDFALARASAEEQIAIGRAIGERIQGVAAGLENLASALVATEEYEGAEETTRELLQVLTEVDYAEAYRGHLECSLGEFRELAGDLSGATDRYERAREIAARVNGRATTARAIVGLAVVAAKDGRSDDADRLCAELDTVGSDVETSVTQTAVPLGREEWLAERAAQ